MRPMEIIAQIEHAIQEAKDSGENRPEYNGYDFFIHATLVEPLIDQASQMPEYVYDWAFQYLVDHNWEEAERAMTESSFEQRV